MKPAKQSRTYTMSRGGIRIGGGSDDAFNSVELTRPDSSWFDLTHDHKLTGNMGTLMPSMIMECYPGDRVSTSNELLIRLQPLISPAMQRLDAYVHTFFIPHRIVWEDFEKFLKGDAVTLPYLDVDNSDVTDSRMEGILDYMGVPPIQAPRTLRINCICMAAYQRVFYEYYRDQNLSTMTDNDKPFALTGDNAGQKAMLKTLRKRAYNHDYFTSALPFTQKGTEQLISFDFQDVPVNIDPDFLTPVPPGTDVLARQSALSSLGSATAVTHDISYAEADAGIGQALFARTTALTGTGFSINEFRLALATQHWLERMAVGGTRMTEIIKAHFGVSSSDQRLDRPEYIGGMRTPVVISEVLQTSESATTPQGNMAGHGIAASFTGDDDAYYCEEHGYIISILSVMPLATYAQGLQRMLDWNARNERNEWYWPEFANLGEQAIRAREVYADVDNLDQDTDWGYTARFNELRYMPNRISGLFRTDLAHYSATRLFATPPTLNEAFLTDILADTGKMFAVIPTEAQHELIVHVLNKVNANRLLPKYATPKLVG